MMKKKLTILLALIFCFWTTCSIAHVTVKGYTKKNGGYVMPHHRTQPDKNFHNNWSTKGNTNTYTGKKGYKKSKSSFGY